VERVLDQALIRCGKLCNLCAGRARVALGRTRRRAKVGAITACPLQARFGQPPGCHCLLHNGGNGKNLILGLDWLAATDWLVLLDNRLEDGEDRTYFVKERHPTRDYIHITPSQKVADLCH
jgi:hypothetical protein